MNPHIFIRMPEEVGNYNTTPVRCNAAQGLCACGKYHILSQWPQWIKDLIPTNTYKNTFESAQHFADNIQARYEHDDEVSIVCKALKEAENKLKELGVEITHP